MPAKSAGLAKLTRPRLFDALPRTRLFAALDAARERSVIWVCGPPGAGKTTLVASFLERRDVPTLWYQLDGGDGDPATFFYYLGLAARSLAPKRRQPLPLLAPEYLSDLPGFSRRFFRELFECLPHGAVVVLDNYQEVPGESAFHGVIEEAVSELPGGVQLIAVSRSEPPAALARARAAGGLALLGWDALRLTPEETQQIAALKQPVHTAAVDRLHRLCDGWAAGLTLMLERLQRDELTPEAVEAESREAAFNYFAGVIFDKAPPDNQHVLLSTAFMPRLTASLAEQLTGHAGAGKLLEFLYRRHLFTDRRPGTEPIYQYHALFRDFLMNRAAQVYTPVALAQIRSRAAQLLESAGQHEAAFGLFLDSADWEAAGALIHKQAEQLLGQGRGQTLREWINALPAEQVEAQPWLSYWFGTSLIPVDQGAARTFLERAYTQFARADHVLAQILAVAGIIESYDFEWTTFVPLDRWGEVLESLLARNPEFPAPEVELRACSTMLVALYRRRPAHPMLGACAQRVLKLLEQPSEPNQRVAAATMLIIFFYICAEPEPVRHLIPLIQSVAHQREVAPLTRVFWLGRLAHYYFREERYGEIRALVGEAAEIIGIHGLPKAAPYGVFILLHQVACATQDVELMGENVDRFASAVATSRSFLNRALMCQARFGLAAHRGDLPLFLRYAQEAVATVERSGNIYLLGRYRVSLAVALAENGRLDEARECVIETRRLLAGAPFRHLHCELQVVDAYLALRLPHRRACDVLLREVLSRAAEVPFLNDCFLEGPQVLTALFQEALRAGIEVETVREAIRKYGLHPPSPDAHGWPWTLEIHTLGGFGVLRDGAPLGAKGKPPAKLFELMQVLVTAGESGLPTNLVAETLWPDAEGDAAARSMDTALYRLRKLVGQDNAVLVGAGRVKLNPSVCWVDAWAFEHCARGASHSSETIVEAGERAAALYRGHFLDQRGDQPWALAYRDRLRAALLALVQRTGETLEAASRWSEAAALYSRTLALDPLAEAIYRRLIICHRERGEHAEAINVYRRCRENLSVVLGIQPSAETRALRDSLTA